MKNFLFWAIELTEMALYKFFYYIDTSQFTGKYTTRKIHKNYIRDPSGLFP